MSVYVPESLRKLVRVRARHKCEYCQIEEDDTFLTFQIDHVISIKHGGPTEETNLAWSCFICNNNKGSDIGTILFPQKIFVRLFNPREDRWEDHFEWDDLMILAKTEIGAATVKVLALNDVERLMERQIIKS